MYYISNSIGYNIFTSIKFGKSD